MASGPAIKVLSVKCKQYLFYTSKIGDSLQKIIYAPVNVISTHAEGPI